MDSLIHIDGSVASAVICVYEVRRAYDRTCSPFEAERVEPGEQPFDDSVPLFQYWHHYFAFSVAFQDGIETEDIGVDGIPQRYISGYVLDNDLLLGRDVVGTAKLINEIVAHCEHVADHTLSTV